MAAHCGNSELLRNLPLLNEEDDQEAGSASLLPRVTMEGDTVLHVVAACGGGSDDGDSHKFFDCVDVIVWSIENRGGAAASAVRLALKALNNKCDTPLHCAARAGNADMISRLVALMANTAATDEQPMELKAAFLRMQNQCGETALHQAVRAPKKKQLTCIDSLMKHDPELACVPHENGASPLYLAISLGEVEIARHLLNTTKGWLSYAGQDGRNVLHAAVSCGQVAALPMVLEWLRKEPKPADNMTQLTRQRDKGNGSTPLHLAAGLWRLSGAPVRLLLDANVSMVYQPDKTGLYPIHVAAGANNPSVVMALLEGCPECATLRDDVGRTFLHVAVEEGLYSIVKYVCQQSQSKRRRSPGLLSILNAQDINGDTPLHRAVHATKLTIFICLVGNRWVRLNIKNKDGMTPIDVSWSKLPLKIYYAWGPRIHIRKYLLTVGAAYGETRGDLFLQKCTRAAKEEEDKMAANLTATVQVLCLFSVLITTVTFASAFTLPGGYRSAGDGVAGTPVLAGRSYVFDAFVLSDALAFICSLYATTLLLYAGVPTYTISARFRTVNRAYTLMWHAGRSLVAAFGLGLYIVLLPCARTIAIAVALLMPIVVIIFIKTSEGIINAWVIHGRIQRMRSVRGIMFASIVCFLDRFWSYAIIFGLPAIRKWAKLP